jgi:hypothetical protein
MSTTKHTPVPWTRGVCNEIRQGTKTVGEYFARQKLIASCFPTNGTKEELDEVFANADFIVQACNAYDELVEQRYELLEACKGTVRALEAHIMEMATATSVEPEEVCPCLLNEVAKAHNAIMKAEGRTVCSSTLKRRKA